jgi:prepilin-type N-terminal cleavage/methylation domain-containing protein
MLSGFRDRCTKKGLTLVELLVSLTIVAILAALLYPVLASAKKKAKEGACLSNLRQIGTAMLFYRDNNDEKLPHRLSDLHPSYLREDAVFHCGLDPRQGQWTGTDRLEGNRFLSSGVSYTFVPNWRSAIDWGWWDAWPQRGYGKWRDQTPLSECHWHWARTFNENWLTDENKGRGGNAVILTMGGEIRFWPATRPLSEWAPE